MIIPILLIGNLLLSLATLITVGLALYCILSTRPLPTADEHDEKEMTREEIDIRLRDIAFDNRIERLKAELSYKQHINTHSTPAEELHPLVHNLPHDSINTYNSLPDVEVAE